MKTKSQEVKPKTVQESNFITNQRHVSFKQLLQKKFTRKSNHIKK